MPTKPHTFNVAIPQALRRRIAATIEITGETVTGFIRAAIVDRLLRLDGIRHDSITTERTD